MRAIIGAGSCMWLGMLVSSYCERPRAEIILGKLGRVCVLRAPRIRSAVVGVAGSKVCKEKKRHSLR